MSVIAAIAIKILSMEIALSALLIRQWPLAQNSSGWLWSASHLTATWSWGWRRG